MSRKFALLFVAAFSFAAAPVASAYQARFLNATAPRFYWQLLPAEIEKELSVADSKFLAPLGEEEGVAYYGCIAFDPQKLVVSLVSRGPRAEAAEAPADLGGWFELRLYPGVRNQDGQAQPLAYALDMAPQREFPFPAPFHAGAEFKRSLSPAVRMLREVPGYDSLAVPERAPKVVFEKAPGGCTIQLQFFWRDMMTRMPFSESASPSAWRLVARRVTEKGTAFDWGTVANPEVVSWQRVGVQFLHTLRTEAVAEGACGRDMTAWLNYARTWWSAYKTERHVGFLEPGVETFEPKNSQSDDIFFNTCLLPVLDFNDKLADSLIAGIKTPYSVAKAASFPQADLAKVMEALPRAGHFGEVVEDLRRDYLLDRFLDRPVRAPVVGDSKAGAHGAKPAAKKTKKLGDISMDELDEQDFDGAGGIDLDAPAF